MRIKKNILITSSLLAVSSLLVATTPVSDTVTKSWQQLQGAKHACQTFDYGIGGGGMRTFYCYVTSFMSYQAFVALAPMPIFLQGPHNDDRPDLDNARSFGHYNPKFVRWLIDNAIPAAEDKVFRDLTRSIYEQKVKPLADLHAAVYQKLRTNSYWRTQQKAKLLMAVQGDGREFGYNEDHFFFMNPNFFAHEHEPNWFYKNGFDGGYSGNVVKTIVAWWVRRYTDGTAGLFYEGLTKLRAAYATR